MKRLVELTDTHQLTIQLAYYPPYHGTYNPVARLRGVLDHHWRVEIIDGTHKAFGLERSMADRGIKPTVCKVVKVYRSGVSVAKQAMPEIEKRLQRKPGLEFWFIKIVLQAQLRYSILSAALKTWVSSSSFITTHCLHRSRTRAVRVRPRHRTTRLAPVLPKHTRSASSFPNHHQLRTRLFALRDHNLVVLLD